MTHPLTDEIILSIVDESLHMPGYQDDMRAAADWQLEQIVTWGYKHLYPDQIDALVSDMRPSADSSPWLETTYDGFKHSIRHSETANE